MAKDEKTVIPFWKFGGCTAEELADDQMARVRICDGKESEIIGTGGATIKAIENTTGAQGRDSARATFRYAVGLSRLIVPRIYLMI